jgi:hypothetical protein
MHVFRLGSKSVNYANKIIMQDAKTDSTFVVSHQLMKNISLSNVSDAGSIVDENNDMMMQMRKYSIQSVPPPMNNSFDDFPRRGSFDYNKQVLFDVNFMYTIN